MNKKCFANERNNPAPIEIVDDAVKQEGVQESKSPMRKGGKKIEAIMEEPEEVEKAEPDAKP